MANKRDKGPLESIIVANIIGNLKKKRGGFWVKIHGGMFQIIGLPDVIGCHRGHFYGFEVKRPGKEDTLTKRQSHILELIRLAGGTSAMVTSVDQALLHVPE